MNSITICLDPQFQEDQKKPYAKSNFQIALFTLNRKLQLGSVKCQKRQLLNLSKIDLSKDQAEIETLIGKRDYNQQYLENWLKFLKTTKLTFEQTDLGVYILLAFAFESMEFLQQLTLHKLTLNNNTFPTYEFINTYFDILQKRIKNKRFSTYLEWFISIHYRHFSINDICRRIKKSQSFLIAYIKVLCEINELERKHLKEYQTYLKETADDENKMINLVFNHEELSLPIDIIEQLYLKEIISEDETRDILHKKKEQLNDQERKIEQERESIWLNVQNMRQMLKNKTTKFFKLSFKKLFAEENLLVGQKLEQMEIEEENWERERNEEKQRNMQRKDSGTSRHDRSSQRINASENSNGGRQYGQSVNGYKEVLDNKVLESSYFERSFEMNNYGQGNQSREERSMYKPQQSRQSEVPRPNNSSIMEDASKSMRKSKAGIIITSIGKTILHASNSAMCQFVRGVTLECEDTVCENCIFNRYMETSQDYENIDSRQMDWEKCKKKGLAKEVNCWRCKKALTQKDVREINKLLLDVRT